MQPAFPTRNPLDVVEILLRVGYYIPLWKLAPQPVKTNKASNINIFGDVTFPNENNDNKRDTNIRYTYTFHPRDLRSCLQVSKHWHRVLLPYLYQIFTYPAMKYLPSSRIDDIAYHIRIFQLCDDTIDPGPTSLRYVNRLTQLDIPRQSWTQLEIESAFGVRLQKQLVRTNCADLVALSWHGYGGLKHTSVACFDLEDFVGFKSLTFLRLEYWFGGEGLLARMLDGVAGTLEVLHLHYISNVLPGAFAIDDEVDNVSTMFKCLSAEGEFRPRKHQRDRRLVLPNLVSLKFTVESERNGGLVELVSCCPHLERLCFTPSNVRDATSVARAITAHDLRYLRSITVKSNRQDDPNGWRNADAVDAKTCAVLIQNCMVARRSHPTEMLTITETTTSSPKTSTTTATPGTTRQKIAAKAEERAKARETDRVRTGQGEGLAKINIQLETFADQERLISAILLHSDSLRALKLTFRGQSEATEANFLTQMVYQLPYLEVLSIKVHRITFDLFKTLGSSSSSSSHWACRDLRKFSFTATNMPATNGDMEDDDGHEDEVEGEVAKGPMGWFKSLTKSWTKSTDKITDKMIASRGRAGTISSTTPVLGWYKHTPSTLSDRTQSVEYKLMRALFRMINKQKLEQLEILVWNGNQYEHSSVPVAPKVKIFPGGYCR
ncbi:hypothetical protein BGW39_008924 [Mortierella sp. 14UC]|nr:hypothetical protein BGW39_008924 [Mortierella sp. 14UC]